MDRMRNSSHGLLSALTSFFIGDETKYMRLGLDLIHHYYQVNHSSVLLEIRFHLIAVYCQVQAAYKEFVQELFQ